ncbi:MAG: hypothetical protein QM723_32995 [Myxococcaceae bacterium]
MTRLFVTAALMLAAPALAKHTTSSANMTCSQRCEHAKTECGDVCNQYAGAKGGAMCKKGCGEGEKKCEDKCKKKGR